MAVSDSAYTGARHNNVFVDPNIVQGKAGTLEFLTKNLGEEIDLLLMFETPKKPGEVFVYLFPVYWKIISLTASGTCYATVEYSGQTALIIPQVEHDDCVSVLSVQSCESGQKCTIKTNPNYDKYLTEAVPGTEGDGSAISTAFAPRLKIYAIRGYRESQLGRANIECPLVWENDLTKLREFTTWNVTISNETNRIVIEQTTV
ncbi:hypothetical protein CVT25_007172 [Psilocybe cyanescens]|uniref:Uncharacterized protein n=1 Tax=Psilocybe cyanescens TaxID=93625 RepID=A0A409XGG5_PSICY|nr:hypothetical protein CVT25_007172 [Psilocybe cyanescens]